MEPGPGPKKPKKKYKPSEKTKLKEKHKNRLKTVIHKERNDYYKTITPEELLAKVGYYKDGNKNKTNWKKTRHLGVWNGNTNSRNCQDDKNNKRTKMEDRKWAREQEQYI